MSLLLRYYEPSSGQIMINGRPITDHNLNQLRQSIGVVSQEPVCLCLCFLLRYFNIVIDSFRYEYL